MRSERLQCGLVVVGVVAAVAWGSREAQRAEPYGDTFEEHEQPPRHSDELPPGDSFDADAIDQAANVEDEDSMIDRMWAPHIPITELCDHPELDYPRGPGTVCEFGLRPTFLRRESFRTSDRHRR